MSDLKLHDFEILREEDETGLKISRIKVPGGWIYGFATPLGLTVQWVKDE